MRKKPVSRREALKAAGVVTASAVGTKLAMAQEQGKTPKAVAKAKPAAAADNAGGAVTNLTPEQQVLEKLWEEHLASEFKDKSAQAAINTMIQRPSVNHVPVMTGGVGRKQLKHFYGKYFIPHMPPDTQIIPISRTIGSRSSSNARPIIDPPMMRCRSPAV